LSYAHAFELVPGIDSIVRFEGEMTLIELSDLLSVGAEWRCIQGIAYRRGEENAAHPLRPPRHHPDALPHPPRHDLHPPPPPRPPPSPPPRAGAGGPPPPWPAGGASGRAPSARPPSSPARRGARSSAPAGPCAWSRRCGCYTTGTA